MPKITAIPGKAVVILTAPENVTASGIVIPDSVEDTTSLAFVIDSAIPDVEAGDTVLLSNKYAGSSFVIDDIEYITVVQEEVLAVMGKSE